MKKNRGLTFLAILSLYLVITALSGTAVLAAGKTDVNSSKVSSTKSYTVMVFLNGTDLESNISAATNDLLEMKKVGSDSNMNVIVETGGTKHWNTKGIDPNQNQRWMMKTSGLSRLLNLGKKDIGDPKTLSDFIIWSIKKYPAKKYVLDLWNHGGGPIAGYGVDEWFNYDSLTLPELETALKTAYKATGKKLEILGFDACLMSSIETASIASPYAKYLVASEELEPSYGWDYTSFLKAIKYKPSISGKELGTAIAKGFKAQADSKGQGESITLSVTDLSKVKLVVTALEALVDKAIPSINDSRVYKTIANGRSLSEFYGGNTEEQGYTDVVDLSDFARNVEDEYSTQSKDIETAITNAVVYSVHGPTKKYSNGLSIYFPYKNKNHFISNLKLYDKINFSKAYQSFIRGFVNQINGNSNPVELSTTTIQNGDGTFEVQINNEDKDNIQHIYCVLGMLQKDNSNIVLNLGMDNNLTYNQSTGIITENFSGTWVALDGHFVTLKITDETDAYNLYAIPVKLNGKEVTIQAAWMWDDTNPDGGYYKILGAWEGISDSTGMADRNIIKIKKGDKITPLFSFNNLSTGETGTIQGDTFRVGDELALEDELLDDGQYLYGFYISDYYQNECYSDFAIFNWKAQ